MRYFLAPDFEALLKYNNINMCVLSQQAMEVLDDNVYRFSLLGENFQKNCKEQHKDCSKDECLHVFIVKKQFESRADFFRSGFFSVLKRFFLKYSVPLLSLRTSQGRLWSELNNIKTLQSREIATVDAVFYSEVQTALGVDSMLITRLLKEYTPLTEMLSQWLFMSRDQQHQLLYECGVLIGRLHAQRLSHNACRPENIIVNLDLKPAVKFISLSRVKFNWMPRYSAISDLVEFMTCCDFGVGFDPNSSQGAVNRESMLEVLLKAYLNTFPMGLTMSGVKMRLTARMGKAWSL